MSSSEILHLSLSPDHARSPPACNNYTSIAPSATNSNEPPATDEPYIPPSPASSETNMETAPLSSLENYTHGCPEFTGSSLP
ncbi:hypothetical protein BDN67DRAFT_1015012 [Paxillus ammoniavirescens]|nr:hypothetical protein BDN67DRAFT_1015012 [Paxillus ammoniavirescens]